MSKISQVLKVLECLESHYSDYLNITALNSKTKKQSNLEKTFYVEKKNMTIIYYRITTQQLYLRNEKQKSLQRKHITPKVSIRRPSWLTLQLTYITRSQKLQTATMVILGFFYSSGPIFIGIMTKKLNFCPVNDRFLKKYCATFTTQHSEGCSSIWMTSQEPPFRMPLTALVLKSPQFQ